MSSKYIVACDGSPASARALQHAIEQAKSSGATIVISHVLEWSPYSFLTPEEIEERHKRRTEELTRAQSWLVDPLVKAVESEGLKVEASIKYGNITEILVDLAEADDATQMFIGRTGSSGLASRVFGSVAGTMAQVSPIPCTIVP